MSVAISERLSDPAPVTFETLPDLGVTTEVDVAGPYADLALGLLDSIEASGASPDRTDVLALYGLMGVIKLIHENLAPNSEDAILFDKYAQRVADRARHVGVLTEEFAKIEQICQDPSLTSENYEV